MGETQTIVVLGGGVGGIVTAVRLRKALPDHHRVVLVDRERTHVFAPSLLWLMVGLRRPERITRPLMRLQRRGIEVVVGEVEAIDATRRQVTVAGRRLEADHLVVALGAELDEQAIAGLADAGHSFYTLAGAQAFRDALQTFPGGRIVVLTATPAYKCPAAPYEAAMLVQHLVRRRGIAARTEVHLYTAEPGPMGVTGPVFSARVRQMVEQRGIHYHPSHRIEGVDPAAGRLHFAGGTRAAYDLLAYVPPHRAPAVVRAAGMVDATGWIPVDRHTLQTRHPEVYAIGDVTTIPLRVGKPLPKAGTFAHGQAEAVVRTLVHRITGRGEPGHFDGHGQCIIETGAGKAAIGRGDFYAEPAPQVGGRGPSRIGHLAKVLFERHWLRTWF